MTGRNQIEVWVLGETQVVRNGRAVALSAGRAAFLAALAATPGRQASQVDLAAMIWSDPPASYRKSLHNRVRTLRRDLGETCIETVGRAYRLGSPVVLGDVERFDQLAASASLDDQLEALALWRGEPYSGLVATQSVWAARSELLARRDDLVEQVYRQLLDRGEVDKAHDLFSIPGLTEELRERLMATPEHASDAATFASVPVDLVPSQQRVVDQLSAQIEESLKIEGLSTLVLAGPAGFGKTTLLRAVELAVPTEVLVLRSACPKQPSQPHETVQTLLADLEEAVELDCSLSPVERLGAGIKLFANPTVVVIDDAQWATTGLLQAIELLQRLGGMVTVVVATRDGEGSINAIANGAGQLTLAPAFDFDDIVHLVLSRGATDESAKRLADLLEPLTEGHPLFVTEAVRTLSETGLLADFANPAGGSRADALPDTLGQIVSDRYASLTLGARVLCERFAVLESFGGATSYLHLADEAQASIDELVSAGLARQAHDRVTMHAEVARTIYEVVAPAARVELHLEAAQRLAGNAPIAAIQHLVQAESEYTPEGHELAVSAARSAVASADWHAAYEMWTLALAIAKALDADHDDIIRLRAQQTDAARLSGVPNQLELMRALVADVRESDSAELLAECALAVCNFGATSDLDADPEFVALADRALAGDLDPQRRARLLSASTHLHALSSDYDLVRSRFDEAYKLAQSIDDDRLLNDVFGGTYMSVVHPSDLDERVRFGHEAVAVAERLGDDRGLSEAHSVLASTALIHGDAEAFHFHVERSNGLVPAWEGPPVQWRVAYKRASQAHLLGDLEGAEDFADQSLHFGDSIGAARNFAVYSALLTAIRLDQGRLGELIPAVEPMVAETPDVPAWSSILAAGYAEIGEDAKADQVLEQFILGLDSMVIDTTYTALLQLTGQAAAQTKNTSLAVPILEHLEPWAGRMSWTGCSSLGPIDVVLAELQHLLGNHDKAHAYADAATQLVAHDKWPIQAMRCELTQYRLADSSPMIENQLRSLRARAEQWGAGAIAEGARRLLRA